MSITTVNITSQTNATINGTPTPILNWTYTLNMANIDAAGVQISNTTPSDQVTIKFSNPGSYNKKQIIIKSSRITIDGENQPLDLSGELLYNGLIHIDDGLTIININNIDIKVNSVSTLNGDNRGWVCEGLMNNTSVTFTNCKVHSADSITMVSTNYSGGICGGKNGSQNPTDDIVNLTFTNCILSAITDINFGGDYGGGICGGSNGFATLTTVTANVTFTFTNCNINSGNNINISSYYNGGICGGGNCVGTSGGSTNTVNLGFTNCDVVATGNIINNSNTGGIICGGSNCSNNGNNNFPVTCFINVTLTFMSCDVSALNITNSTLQSGGICGGFNGSGNRTNVTGPVNLIFTTCVVSTTNDITINGDSDGGICGGYNGISGNNVNVTLNFTNCNLDSSGGIAINATNNGGICGGNNNMTVTFTNCILYYCTFITFEGGDISSVTYFYLLLPGPPLYIIGNSNTNTMTLDQLSGIKSNCLPPPPCNPPPDPPNLWSRATLSCVDYDYEQLAMRRKAEILNYKGNKNPLTKKQQFSRNVNGNGPLGKKVWATQNILGSNPNVFNLPQVGNTLILCPDNNTDNNNYTLSSTLIGNISNFGKVVSISGDGNTLAIRSSSQQTVYVYTKNINNSWSVSATLYEPTIISFGSSLQLSYDGNTLITGAYLHSFFLIEDGRIFIYEKIASVWTQTFIYTGANTKQRLGKSVSISNDGSVIAVGSQFDNNVTYNGKIEVFERNGPHWNSAAPTGPILIAYGLNSEQLSDSGIFLNGNGNFIAATTVVNKIYVYKKNGASWTSGNTIQTLTISSEYNVYFDTNANYLCIGTLSGNIAYVYKYNTTTSLFEPQQSFNNLDGTSSTVIIISPDGKYIAIGLPDVNSNTGVVYIYKIINNTWNLIQKIYGDRINSLFGTSLSFDTDGYTLAIGASSADAQPGKVYIYFRNGTIITTTIKCEPSSSSDVPGNSILCYDPAVPLVNYLPPPRTYLAGGTKWPQSSWQPGDNGFPRGKKGSMSMLFQ